MNLGPSFLSPNSAFLKIQGAGVSFKIKILMQSNTLGSKLLERREDNPILIRKASFFQGIKITQI